MSQKPSRKKILLFEDDYESMCDLKEHLEEMLDWDVELTADAGLLERLKNERFDLIIVDLMIRRESQRPGEKPVTNVHFEGVNWRKTGSEFVKRLRTGEFSGPQGTAPDVPVILLSAVASYSAEETLGESPALVHQYAEKPFRLEDLVSIVRSCLEE
jgi:CheY-like chemotaxis protein